MQLKLQIILGVQQKNAKTYFIIRGTKKEKKNKTEKHKGLFNFLKGTNVILNQISPESF